MFVLAPSSCKRSQERKLPCFRADEDLEHKTDSIANNGVSDGEHRAQSQRDEDPGSEPAVLGRAGMGRDDGRGRCCYEARTVSSRCPFRMGVARDSSSESWTWRLHSPNANV